MKKTIQTRVFRESLQPRFKQPVREEKESKSFDAKVKDAIKSLMEMDADVMYTALAIWDMCGETKPDKDLCDEVAGYLIKVDNIYDEYLREEIRELVDRTPNDDFDEDEYADEMEDGFWQDKIDDKVKKVKTDEIDEDVEISGIKLSKPKHNIAKKIKK